jgi:hypothetical protein
VIRRCYICGAFHEEKLVAEVALLLGRNRTTMNVYLCSDGCVAELVISTTPAVSTKTRTRALRELARVAERLAQTSAPKT